jgi:hypothetical protein
MAEEKLSWRGRVLSRADFELMALPQLRCF